uniref:DUF4283 domain-containing protein n=1 Tax=Cannabis sativa TaxID=3483 RepID=A0A803QJ08_CANSA
MGKLYLTTTRPLEILVLCPASYITDRPMIFPASCTFLIIFLYYIFPTTLSLSFFSPFVSRFTLKMDDLSYTLTAARNLTELETQIHTFSETLDHPEDDEREEPSAFLVVKLLTNRHFNSEAFKKRLRQIWPERFSINVLEEDPNFYTVEFGCFGNRRRVLIGQPWHFDYKFIVMTPLEAGSVVIAEMLTSTPFWIQVFLKRSPALAQQLGEVLGGLGPLTYMSALNSM